jgi:hypothetical protein
MKEKKAQINKRKNPFTMHKLETKKKNMLYILLYAMRKLIADLHCSLNHELEQFLIETLGQPLPNRKS